ncbi:hypothetical protein CK203_081631 [Vitis vinifera]|uniref:Uncharacterized protein n=1 Tax=Vitis vinifera TaxID=29760 RepID=A0A438DPR5_VITVI|nr:hypothetical protein CK203_081631 [Vitis vinifera]
MSGLGCLQRIKLDQCIPLDNSIDMFWQLFQLSSQDPLYLVLLNNGNSFHMLPSLYEVGSLGQVQLTARRKEYHWADGIGTLIRKHAFWNTLTAWVVLSEVLRKFFFIYLPSGKSSQISGIEAWTSKLCADETFSVVFLHLPLCFLRILKIFVINCVRQKTGMRQLHGDDGAAQLMDNKVLGKPNMY